jgi:hypothetical protein
MEVSVFFFGCTETIRKFAVQAGMKMKMQVDHGNGPRAMIVEASTYSPAPKKLIKQID